ncbi:unnamed protein product [Rotaria sp. Silwood2]|nr:unnamed protein product [Rotaria sp. Silwood2]
MISYIIEKGEGKSSVYRFCLHDNIYAFINTRSKLFHNSTANKSDSILSTHTIVRLIENIHDLNGNAPARLMKSIISSNRDLQRNKQQQQQQSSNKTMTASPTTPIGTQFALTMLGANQHASSSLQQHVSSTLGTLIQVQNSLSTSTINSPNEKIQSQQQHPPTPSPSPIQNRLNPQKSSTLENVTSSDTVEFGSKRTSFSPSLGSVHSNHGSLSSPVNTFDIFFSSPTSVPTNSNDLNSFLLSPTNPKTSSPFFSNNDIYTTSSSPKSHLASPSTQNLSRGSTRLRQLLTNKSPPTNENPSQTLHYLPDAKLEDFIQGPESPTTTHVSPLTTELSSSSTTATAKRRRKNSSTLNEQNNSTDVLLKKILGRQNSFSTSPIKTESNHSDDSSSSGQTTNKQRSDIFLRTLLKDEVRPQKVVVETPFAIGARQVTHQYSTNNTNVLVENNKTKNNNVNNTRLTLKTQLSDISDVKTKKKPRQNSTNFSNQNNPMPRKPGRPKRNPTEYLLTTTHIQTPQSTLSDGSLDSLLDSSANLDQPITPRSPNLNRRTTRQTSNITTMNLKRSSDNDEHLQVPRKCPKLLTEALQKDLKIECQDISPSTAIAATKLLSQSSQSIIKSEPQQYEHNLNSPLSQTQICRTMLSNNINSSSTSNTQSSLLRTSIRTSQPPSIITKKDGPLYDLLEHFDTTTTLSNDNSFFSGQSSMNNSFDPFEQYLSPVLSQPSITNNNNNNNSSKDDYLTELLNSDPQKPNEISFIPTNKQQTINDNNRITAIANELLNSTTLGNNSNDDFLSLLENKDFLECLNDSTAIDSILSQNSSSLIEQSCPTATTITKRSEKDEKAISEIYKTLVTSFNPGSSQQSSSSSSSMDPLSVDNNSSSNSITGDFLFTENTNPIPSNRTVNHDPLTSIYCQSSVPPPSSTFPYSINNTQFTDCLSMDLLDNSGSFPPNVTLSPMTNSYSSQPTPTLMNTNSMMMYPQQPDAHIQHRQTPNHLYRQTPQQQQQQQQQQQLQQQQQQQQQSMYNNYIQPSPSNQVPAGYYSMPLPSASQQQQQQQQRISSANHHHPASIAKRQTLMQQQQQQQRASAHQQQVQFHMSMNVTLPHMITNQQQQQQQQQQQITHRPMMNPYNDLIMPNSNIPPLQQDYHQYSNNNPFDLPYNSDHFMSQSSNMGQQSMQNRHMNVIQHQQPLPPPPSSLPPSHPQAAMHQQYSNMSVALSATIQQNSHNSNNLMNPSISNLTPAECRQSEELNNQMMNCLSFQPVRSTSEFVRKQLQNTIQGRQKPAGGKDLSGTTGHNSLSANLDCNQKGAFFRTHLSSQMPTTPLQTTVRPQQQDKPT